MDRSRHGIKRNNARDRCRQPESSFFRRHGSSYKNEKIRDGVSRQSENGEVNDKERNQVDSRNPSSTLSLSSSSSSSHSSDRKADREPGELSSGSEDNRPAVGVRMSGARVSRSPKPSQVLAKKRKYSPIVWDQDERISSKSSSAEGFSSVHLVAKDSEKKIVQHAEVKVPSSLNEKEEVEVEEEEKFEEEEDAPPRVLSASRWADANFNLKDDDEEEPAVKQKMGEEDTVKEESLTLEHGELREESTLSVRARSSSLSDGEGNHSVRTEGSEEQEDYAGEGQPGGIYATSDPMEFDAEDGVLAEKADRPNSRIVSDKEVDVSADTDGTKELALPRKINMLQGCRSVDEFERLNRIDEGTYGVVYRARDKKTGEIVALKKVKMEKEREGFPLTSLREINILLSFHHPSIVDVKEVVVGSNLDSIFMVMEYMDHDLKGLMESMKQPFSQSEVKCLMLQLLEGVKYLHDNWVLHRDLKTSNLLMNNRGELKICDFGLARQYGSPLRAYTQLVVTLWYRAPELLLGAKLYSTTIDMWSLGCIMAELLAKEPLFSGKTEIDQLNKIYRTLGTPSEKIWPGYSKLPGAKFNFPKQPYNKLREKFPKFTATSFSGKPQLSDAGFDLLNKLLTYDPEKRITAEDALNHDWFSEFPPPKSKEFMPTFPAQHAQDRRLRRVMKSPDPLEELRKKELQRGELLGATSLFG